MTTISTDGGMTAFYEDYWAHRVERGDHTAGNRVKLRHEQAAGHLRRALAGRVEARVLDLGCGDGLLGQVLEGEGWSLSGADLSGRALDLCRPYYDELQRLDLDADAVPESWRGRFDGVACLEVLEHLRRPEGALAKVREMLTPGGVAALSYPNLFSWKNRLVFLRGRWPEGYTTYDPMEHLQVFDLPGFRRLVAEAGLEVTGLEITPDLPRWKPARRAMFAGRGVLGRVCPSWSAMQINVYARRGA